MALSKIDVANMLTGATPVANGGTALTSGFSNGLTVVEEWVLTSNKTSAGDITANLSLSSFTGVGTINAGMSQSSGIFTFPQTGIYFIMSQHAMNTSASSCGVQMRVSSDSGSSYSTVSYGQITNTNNGYHQMSLQAVVDVQNASTYRFGLRAYNTANVQYSGDSDALRNGITFIRLGDT